MNRTDKIKPAVIIAAVIVSILLLTHWDLRIEQYRNGFSQVELGQSKATVLNLMGEPSENKSCSFKINNSSKNLDADCFELNTYQGFYEKWAVAFENNGEVVDKYYWFLGD